MDNSDDDDEDRLRRLFHHYVFKNNEVFDREENPALGSFNAKNKQLLLQYHMNGKTRFKTAMDSALHVLFYTFSLNNGAATREDPMSGTNVECGNSRGASICTRLQVCTWPKKRYFGIWYYEHGQHL